MAVIALLQVLQTSSVANTGATIQRLENEQAVLQADIHRLESEVAALSSLDRIERNARERLGMVPARTTEYITVEVPAPSGPLLPRPIVGLAQQPAAEGQSWWQELLRALPIPLTN